LRPREDSALEKVIRETRLDIRDTILHKSLQILAYADDDIIGRYGRTVKETYISSSKQHNKWG
jgi:hypothetical protein